MYIYFSIFQEQKKTESIASSYSLHPQDSNQFRLRLSFYSAARLVVMLPEDGFGFVHGRYLLLRPRHLHVLEGQHRQLKHHHSVQLCSRYC